MFVLSLLFPGFLLLFIQEATVGEGKGGDSSVPQPRLYLPHCDVPGRFGLRVCEVHGEMVDVDRAVQSGRRRAVFPEIPDK